MGLMPGSWIREMAQGDGMIEPSPGAGKLNSPGDVGLAHWAGECGGRMGAALAKL